MAKNKIALHGSIHWPTRFKTLPRVQLTFLTTPTDLSVGGFPPNMCLGITHEEKMPTQAKPMPYMGSRGKKCTKNRPKPKNSDSEIFAGGGQ